MAIKINLPQVGESVTEGVIGKWLKKVGDNVEKYDSLVEVMTDKVNMDFPSPYNGKLTAILAKEGDTVPMGDPIAEMETDDPGEDEKPDTLTEQPSSRPIGRIGILLKNTKPVGPTGSGEEEPFITDTIEVSTPKATPAPKPAVPDAKPTNEATPGNQRLSPIVKRLADEHKVDINQVRGTGMGGRITKEDVQRHIQKGPIPRSDQTPTQPSGPNEEAIPLTPLRRIIADNMTKSASQIPQAWISQEVNVTSMVTLRQSIKSQFREKEGVDLTYLPFVIRMLVEALKEHPRVNSSWGGDKVILKKRLNIGIAVATAEGLIVPVIQDAGTMQIADLARSAHEIIQRARNGKLTIEDVQGGTFTVNNTGALGSIVSQPLIPPPQAAILTSEAIVKRPVVLPGDTIAVRSMMNIGLTFDHRILDGSDAGSFLASVRQRLERIGEDTPIYQ
jgi:2-oxoisovalerate dehydrogenase E2 component (dihydrolipoyl transacylase)